jgi:hypothetical protein
LAAMRRLVIKSCGLAGAASRCRVPGRRRYLACTLRFESVLQMQAKACPAKSLPSGLAWLDPRVGPGFAKKDMLNQKA